MKLCIIDDDEVFLNFVDGLLARRKDERLLFKSPATAVPAIRSESPDALIWSISLFRDQDIDTLKEIRRDNPALLVALAGAINGNHAAHHLLNKGVCEFLPKPVTPDQMEAFLRQLEAPARFSHPAELHSSLLIKKYRFFELIGKSPEMTQLFEKIEIISKNHGTVLIQGEMGTGKDLVARAIHHNSERRKGPFIKFPCSIIPKEIFDLELFGGSTEDGAEGVAAKKSPFDLAAGGTLFLDEVEHIPLETQVRLIEYFQTRAPQSGADALAPRIVAGSTSDLRELTQQRRFRYELFYRINILPVDIPPLRKRRNDIPMLVDYFLEKYSPKARVEVDPEVMKLLVNFAWPGNIRQLENIIERLVLTVPGRVIFRHHLPEEIAQEGAGNFDFDSNRALDEVVAEVESLMIKKALFAAQGNKKLAAKNLKVPYSSFRIKLRKYDID